MQQVGPGISWLGLGCLLSFVLLFGAAALAMFLFRRAGRRDRSHGNFVVEPPRELGVVSLQQAPPASPVALGVAPPAVIQPGTIQRMPARDAQFVYTSGDRPLDGYTIKRGIGRGGFGEVYYAMSDGGKEVALKLVQRHLDVELRGVTQCLNLKHPNLVTIYDVKQAANGDYWIVMEYLNGAGLSDVLAANPNGLPHDQVLAWLRGIADGVGYLHEHGIVHRDLKPGNIFVENGAVKIGDYGLAKFISASRRSGQTESVGTVHYMAPEVAHGRYGKEIDLYAIGVILYELLTGRVPFNGQSPGEIMMKHLTAQPDVSVLPEPYRAVVERLLAKDPSQRYSSVTAMLAELSGAAPPSPPVPMAPPAQKDALQRTGSWHDDIVRQPASRSPSRHSLATVIGSCIGFIGTIALLVMIVYFARSQPDSQRFIGHATERTDVAAKQETTTRQDAVQTWRRFPTHPAGVVGLEFELVSKRLLSVYRDGTLLAYVLEKPTTLLQLSGVAAASFTPDGTGIIVSETAGDQTGSVRIVDAGTGETKVKFEGVIGPITRFAFARGAPRVAGLNDNGRLVRTWNTETGVQESMFGKEMSEPAFIGIAFRDVRNLLAVDERLQAWLWDSAPGNAKPTQLEGTPRIVQGGFTATSAVFSRNAESYAAGLDIGRIYYRTVQELRFQGSTALIHAHSGPVQSVAVSGQRNWLASSGEDGTTRLYTTGSSPEQFASVQGSGQNTVLALNEDGSLLASGDASGNLLVYKVLPEYKRFAQPTPVNTSQADRSAAVASNRSTPSTSNLGIGLKVIAIIAIVSPGAVLLLLIVIGRSRRALIRAAKVGDISRVRLLLLDGADIHGRRWGKRTALIAAAEAGHIAVVQHLLERGADPNARLSDGETALSLATVAGHAAVVETLIAAGADVNSRASDGDTPLIEAAYAGQVGILRKLLEHGGDMTARSGCDGSTPLIWAAYGGHTGCVEALLEHGANINEKDTGDGSTPLIWAAYGNHPNVVRVLLDHGADPNETNSSGETAMDHAESDTITALLEAAVARR